jgi:hypothetical protein
MPQNTNEASIPVSADPEAIGGADVDAFMHTLTQWATHLPRKEQALLHLMLAAAASVKRADVHEWLAGFPIPNPRDVIVAATGNATGATAGAVVGASADAIAGDMSDAEATGAAGAALARGLLSAWGDVQR